MSFNKNSYRSHDYKFLLQRWRRVCHTAGLKIEKVAEIDGLPCFEVTSPMSKEHSAIYLSAGIHGDESGSTEGLLAWAESNLDRLNSIPLLIYPCLNPWGLINNSRWDAKGTDLNRIWENPSNPFIQYIISRTKNITIQLVITLHEDFDGQGVYLYEPSRNGISDGRADEIISAATPFITPDPRRKIDGRKAKNGIIRPRPTNPPKDGMPEALYFYLTHKCPTFTFETPSELDLSLRVQAQSAMIGHALVSDLKQEKSGQFRKEP